MNSIEVKDIETSIEPKNECYICCEPGAPKSCCDCKNIFLHSKCQLKMVTELNDCTCRICKKDYKNIRHFNIGLLDKDSNEFISNIDGASSIYNRKEGKLELKVKMGKYIIVQN